MAQLIDLKKKPQQEVHPIPSRSPAPFPRNPVSHSPRSAVIPATHQPVVQARLSKTQTEGDDYDIAWRAPSSSPSPYPRFFSMFIATLLGIAGIIFFVRHEVMFPIVLVASSLLLIIHKGKKSHPVAIAITQTGIVINETSHAHNDWKSFWIEYQPSGIQELSLESKRWHLPYVKVPLAGQDPIMVRDVLMQYLPEEEHKRSLTDLFVHLLGF